MVSKFLEELKHGFDEKRTTRQQVQRGDGEAEEVQTQSCKQATDLIRESGQVESLHIFTAPHQTVERRLTLWRHTNSSLQ